MEWIRDDKTHILTEGSSLASIIELQPFFKVSKKRKRGAEESRGTNSAAPQDAPPDEVGEREVEAKDEKPESSSLRRTELGTETAGTKTSSRRNNDNDAKVAGSPHTSPPIDQPDSKSLSPEYHFYLLKPRTSSSRHVLIPVSPTATLGACLRSRTVLEFPTIYGFPATTSPPSEQFVLEEAYLKQEDEEQKEFDELLMTARPETLRALKQEAGDDNASGEIDSSKILDVLKQDIGAGV